MAEVDTAGGARGGSRLPGTAARTRGHRSGLRRESPTAPPTRAPAEGRLPAGGVGWSACKAGAKVDVHFTPYTRKSTPSGLWFKRKTQTYKIFRKAHRSSSGAPGLRELVSGSTPEHDPWTEKSAPGPRQLLSLAGPEGAEALRTEETFAKHTLDRGLQEDVRDLKPDSKITRQEETTPRTWAKAAGDPVPQGARAPPNPEPLRQRWPWGDASEATRRRHCQDATGRWREG